MCAYPVGKDQQLLETFIEQFGDGVYLETIDNARVDSETKCCEDPKTYPVETHLDRALTETKSLGAKGCAVFRAKIFTELEPLCQYLSEMYIRTSASDGVPAANEQLRRIRDRLVVSDAGMKFNMTADRDDLRKLADHIARSCVRVVERIKKRWPGIEGEELLDAFREYIDQYMSAYRIKYPSTFGCDQEKAIESMTSQGWWRRRMCGAALAECENVIRELGFIRKGRAMYVSDRGALLRRWQRLSMRKFIEDSVVVNFDGDTFPLAMVVDSSISNPVNRRAELMVRLKGCENNAHRDGHMGAFITLTTPSRMHAGHSKTGINVKFDGTRIKEANDYLCRQWARLRASLDRHGIGYYGFRMAEPHADGTPHWHFMLFFRPRDEVMMRALFREYALQVDGDEPGADKHRLKWVTIDPAKGSAVGYCSKYVSKNIDGFRVDNDDGSSAIMLAERIEAWSRIHCIRQFQQVGGVPVGVYRWMRRLREINHAYMDTIRVAADTHDWMAYTDLMGGMFAGRDDLPVRVVSILEESTGSPVAGLLYRPDNELVQVQRCSWRIERGTVGNVDSGSDPPLLGLVCN